MSKTKKQNNRKYLLLGLIVLGLMVFGFHHANTKLTYKEYKSFNTSNDTYIKVASDGESLTQEFEMPYEILESVAVQISTFARDNNSTWAIYIAEADTGEDIYSGKFNASQIVDNAYFEIELDKNIRVTKGGKYVFTIQAIDVSEISALAFYVSATPSIENESLYHSEELVDGDMCFKIYGGDVDYWWHGLIIAISAYLLLMIFRAYYANSKGRKLSEDKCFQALALGAIAFLLLCSFSVGGTFTDENDNIRGGLVISNGGVLYKDYVTQHTPVVYYLCSIFAMLGAGSVIQFRLSYYFLEALIWIFIYMRNADFYGKKKIFLLSILEVVCTSSVISPQGYQILSDGWQGLMFVILMLEFLRYYQDKKIGWDRSIILSICIWGSFGAAFVSAYALIWVAIIFLFIEIKDWLTEKITARKIIGRYYKFFISLIVPLAAAILYFKANHSLRRAFDQFYTFNREVYPKYTSGLGENIAQPFINGIQNFFNIIANNFNSIVKAEATNVTILQLVIMALAVSILIKLFERNRFTESIILLLMTIFSATRGYGFHGLAAWYIAVMIIALNTDCIKEMKPKLGKPVIGIISIILMSTYVVAVGNNLLYEQPSVSELESQVIALTENDEDKDIFLDAYCCDSIYFFYKDRKPVNAAVYMLPWYMDWYEKDDIDALNDKNPHIVVYNEDRTTWKISHYTVAFEEVLRSNYTRLGDADSGWKYSVWIRNQ